MTDRKTHARRKPASGSDATPLFLKAEEALKVRLRENGTLALEDVCRLLYEFDVRQVELQMENEELRAAVQRASAANESKSRFLANVSHELRTPMNAIIGMTALAIKEPITPTARDYLKTVGGSAHMLLEILNELLDFSRIEAGRVELEPAPFALRPAIEDTIKSLEERACEKGLRLSCHLADNLPEAVLGDSLRLRQVLINLIGNAIKFTDHGEVVLRVVEEEGRGEKGEGREENEGRRPQLLLHLDKDVDLALLPSPFSPLPSCSSPLHSSSLRFSVSDTGIGISAEHQKRIFDPFIQADQSAARRYGGTGLGLSIASTFVGMMGGHIQVESRPGCGSTFWFTVRMHRVDGPLPPPPPPTLSAVPTRVCRVLLAEDNAASRKVAVCVLQGRGHLVEIAEDGRQAIQSLERGQFDVVLMDIEMPILDGLKATAAIRRFNDPVRSRIPIIAMTAHARESDRQECIAGGMDAYLSKPIRAEQLLELVERLANERGERGEGEKKRGEGRLDRREGVVLSPLPSPVSPPPSSSPAVFRLHEAVSRCFGNHTIFREMVDYFFDEADPTLETIRAAFGRADWTSISQAAHRLRNTVMYLADEPLMDATTRVEELGRRGARAGMAEAVEELSRQVARVKAVLQPHASNAVMPG